MSMPPVQDDLPDASLAEAVLTVASKRAVVLSGFASGALVLCIYLFLLGLFGLVSTFLFNRGIIYAGNCFSTRSTMMRLGATFSGAAQEAINESSKRFLGRISATVEGEFAKCFLCNALPA